MGYVQAKGDTNVFHIMLLIGAPQADNKKVAQLEGDQSYTYGRTFIIYRLSTLLYVKDCHANASRGSPAKDHFVVNSNPVCTLQ